MVSKISFGEPIGFLDHGSDFNGMIKSQKQVFRYISIVNNMPILDAMLKRNPFLKLVKRKPSMFFTFAKDIVSRRIAQADKDPEASLPKSARQPDLLGSFIAARKSYPLMTDLRITHLSTTNVVAGANNSALAMDQTIHYLAKHPEAQERLYQEITTVDMADMKESESPAALELALKLPYLEAVILESYRKFGSPSNNLERVVPSPSGMTLPSGTHLPPGSVVAMNAAAMAMLPHVYGTPEAPVEEFSPDRWMKRQGGRESDEEFRDRRARMERSMLVFGHGSRSCIGKNVVQLELYKIWATLLRLYRFEPVDVRLHQVMVIPRRREKEASGGMKSVQI